MYVCKCWEIRFFHLHVPHRQIVYFIKRKILIFFCHLSFRYSHDGSETVEDNVEFTATDGTNSVSFVLQVKVILLISQNNGPPLWNAQSKCHPLLILLFLFNSLSSPGETRQWRGPGVGSWLEAGPQLWGGTGNSHHSRVYLRHRRGQWQQHPHLPDRPAAVSWCGSPERCHRRSLHPGRHHRRDHCLQTHRWVVHDGLRA